MTDMQTMSLKNLKIMYWNIHGLSSKIIGNKNNDPHFLETIGKADIVCLSELHTDKHIAIPGYKVMKQKFRPKEHKGP